MIKLIFFLFLPLTLLFFSCKTYNEEDKASFDDKINAYIEQEHIEGMVRSESGLYFKIIEPGEDRKIRYDDEVKFRYKGTLIDGAVFDDQTEDGQQFKVRELIPAWKEIMLELGKGAKVQLIAPPQLGYGDHDLEKIPKHSILIYELEIIEVI